MRRVVAIAAFIAMLLVIDAVANDFRFTSTFFLELRQFGRLFNRFVGRAFNVLGQPAPGTDYLTTVISVFVLPPSWTS